jgi:hypothetical protein
MAIVIPITVDMEPVKNLIADWEQKHQSALDEIERLRTERDRWAKFATHVATCPNWGRRTCWDCVSPTNQDQAREAGLEETIRTEYGQR